MGFRHSDDDEPSYPRTTSDREVFLLKARRKRAQHNPRPRRPMLGESFRLLDEYVGVYGDYAYGNVTISIDGDTGNLVMVYGREAFT